MQYWDNVTRSFRIAWRHKYLWLIALFSGEGGAGFNSSFNQGTGGRTGTPSTAQIQQQVTTWVSEHVGLIVFLIVLWVVLAVAFFILAAVCEGATVRAAAEHDAERPFGLGWAWRSGVATMWVIIRFRLLLLALILPVVLILAGLVFGAVASIPYFIYLFFLDRFGSRAVILEQLGARAAIVRAHRLLFKRLGRALLVWLLAVAVSIVVGILFACVAALIAVPFALIGVALFASGSAAVVPLIVVGVLILLPIVLIVQGFLTAQGSTYWTLAFRRIELEPPTPSYYQPVQPAPPPPPQVTS